MNNLELEQAREKLTWQVLGATTLPEVLAAQYALRNWIATHPEDEGMSDAFEQLSLMQDAAEEQEAERIAALRKDTPIGQPV